MTEKQSQLQLFKQTIKKKFSKYITIDIILAIIIGFFIAIIFAEILLSILFINIPPVYTSTFEIDEYGANSTSGHWSYFIQPEKKYMWDTTPTGFAWVDFDTRHIEQSFDLSNYTGMSFYIKSNIECQPIIFSIFTHNNISEDYYHVVTQYKNRDPLIVSTNWRRITYHFSEMVVSNSQSDSKINPKSVFALGFSTITDKNAHGEIWIDDLYLIDKNGNRTLMCDFNKSVLQVNGIEGIWHAGSGHL